MKNRATDEPLFVVIFTLIPKEDVEKLGGEKAAEKAAKQGPELPKGTSATDGEDVD